MQQHVVILFAGRYPSEKAAALFVDLNARSLVQAGARVTVVAPRRLGRGTVDVLPYTLKYLPVIDLSRVPVLWSAANFLTVWVFAKCAYVWLLLNTGKDDVVISNDAWPLLVATLLRKNTIYEMHDFARRSFVYRALFRRVRYVLVTNEWKRNALKEQFGVPEEKIMLERNAVDVDTFGKLSKEDAREQLGLEQRQRIAVYTGHLYEWKGADTLAKAAAFTPDVQCIFIGGAPADIEQFRTQWGAQSNIHVVGHVEHELVPVWQSAADVLVLPNSGKEEISVHYTSPMKLFEYMASARPIVASDLPSIREVLPADIAYYATPDDPASFASAIGMAMRDASGRGLNARALAEIYTWKNRAERILSRII